MKNPTLYLLQKKNRTMLPMAVVFTAIMALLGNSVVAFAGCNGSGLIQAASPLDIPCLFEEGQHDICGSPDSLHTGVDIDASEGTPVYNILDGGKIVLDNTDTENITKYDGSPKYPTQFDQYYNAFLIVKYTYNNKVFYVYYGHIRKTYQGDGNSIPAGTELGTIRPAYDCTRKENKKCVESERNTDLDHLHFGISKKYYAQYWGYLNPMENCPEKESCCEASDPANWCDTVHEKWEDPRVFFTFHPLNKMRVNRIVPVDPTRKGVVQIEGANLMSDWNQKGSLSMTTFWPRSFHNPRTGRTYPLARFRQPSTTAVLDVDSDKWTDGMIQVDLGIEEFDMPVEIKITRNDGEVLDKLYYPFQDVPPCAWFADYVSFLWERDIIKGPGDGAYGLYYPNDNITRAAFLKVLVEASGNYLKGYPQNHAGSVCADVAYGSWYYDYFMRAADLDWLSDSACDPGDYAQRGFAARLAALAHSGKSSDFFDSYQPQSDDFKDITPSKTDYKYIMYCKDHHIFEGYSSGYFASGKRITRGELAKVIFKAFLERNGE